MKETDLFDKLNRIETMPETWRCSRCHGGPWEYAWTDEDARAEHRVRFGHDPAPDAPKVCDDCYDAMLVANGLLALVGANFVEDE